MIAPTAQQTTIPGVPTPAATPPQGIQQVLPGQAGPMAMNQMLMQQQAPAGGAGVGSFVKPLSTLDPVSLQKELLSPVSQYPKFAVLAALDEQNKKRKAAEAMQQQLSMNLAQTQGQGTVADQIVAESGQLQGAYAHGGEVQKFQAGGSTAFDDLFLATRPDRQVGAVGGETYEEREKRLALEKELAAAEEARQRPLARLLQAISPESKLRRSMYPSREELLAAREGRAPQKAATVATPQFDLSGSPAENISALVGALRANPNMPAEERNAIARRISTLSANLPRGETGAEEQPPRREPLPDTGAGVGAKFQSAPQGDMFADPRNAILANQGYTNAQIAHMRSSAEPTPEIIESRKGLAALRQRQFEESQKETADVRAEAERRLQEAKARPGIFSDPEALASLAASISTRKGELMGSAAKGLAGVQGERRKALEAAQEKYGMSQEKIRTMNALNRQMELAMVEKAHAEKVGDWQGVQKANADIAALLAANAKFAATTGLGIAGLQEQARGHDIQLQIAKIRAEAGGDGEAGSNLPYMREVTSVSKVYEPMIQAELSPTKKQGLIAQYAAEINKVRERYNMSPIGTPGAPNDGKSGAQNDPLNIRNP